MNSAHVHLLLNHLPVLGTGFGLVLLAAAVVRKSAELLKVALFAFVIMALIAVPAYLTGEPAADLVQSLPGVSRGAIEAHEDFAGGAFAALEILGVFSLAGLLLARRRPAPRWFLTVALVLAVVISGLMAYTANLGGQIRHSEIGGPTLVAPAATREAD